MTGDGLFVGLDLGTSSLKAVAVGAGGEVAARAHAGYPTARPEPGAAEQSPADWWAAVEAAVAALAAGGAPPERWAAVGLSGMIPTLVVTDDAGEPVAPAITWEDGRAEPEGDALRAGLGGERLYGLTGQWVDGRYLLPMYRRLARVAPRAARRARRLLGAKDWLFWRLTGEPATDPSTATGFGCYGLEAGSWLDEVVAAAESRSSSAAGAALDGARGPCLSPASARLGLPPACRSAWVAPTPCWAAWAWASSVPATSPVSPARAPYCWASPTASWSTPPIAISSRRSPASTAGASRWTCSPPAAPSAGWRGCWARPAATRRPSWPWRRGVAPGADGLAFLPYLAPGEQGALWDPTISGALFGLSLGHGAADVARALVDGIVLESRRCLSVLDQAGLPRGVGAHGRRQRRRPGVSPAARRRLPAHGRPCRRRRDGALGDRGGGGGGHGRRPWPLGPPPPATLETIAPQEERSARWDVLWERHEAALRALRAAPAADRAS